jgi:hypothetical protein
MHTGYGWESQRERKKERKLRCKWVDNIRIDLGEVGRGYRGLDWSG